MTTIMTNFKGLLISFSFDILGEWTVCICVKGYLCCLFIRLLSTFILLEVEYYENHTDEKDNMSMYQPKSTRDVLNWLYNVYHFCQTAAHPVIHNGR